MFVNVFLLCFKEKNPQFLWKSFFDFTNSFVKRIANDKNKKHITPNGNVKNTKPNPKGSEFIKLTIVSYKRIPPTIQQTNIRINNTFFIMCFFVSIYCINLNFPISSQIKYHVTPWLFQNQGF